MQTSSGFTDEEKWVQQLKKTTVVVFKNKKQIKRMLERIWESKTNTTESNLYKNCRHSDY